MKRVLSIAVLALAMQATASAQTIADIARQERARRAAMATNTVVLTNESLKNLPQATAAAAPGQPSPQQDQTAESAAPVRDEKYWREAFQHARAEIKRAEDRVALLQLELNRANRDYLQRSDVYNREFRIGAEIADIKARLDIAQKDLAAAHQKLSLLEEEFRRSGAPAGWAR